ncbi:MAG TPA: alpha/beta hydrolase [Lapillicoccus sp.]|nr:alpha/beta hydrolase [Lapillicoccus sp.]
MEREPFRASTSYGDLVGWVAGDGPPVVALHGGPGLNYEYLDDVVEELVPRFRVATFQQRGLAPSTIEGPFTVDQAVADVASVLDALGWQKAYVVGHSWGGHLAFHVAHDLAPRLLAVLSVDPLGGVGDGGTAVFGETLLARTPEAHRARARELDEKDTAGEATEAESLEALRLVWSAYYATPATAPTMPPMRTNRDTSRGLWRDLEARLPTLESTLPDITVPVGVLVGAASPMPPEDAGIATARRIPGAWWVTVPGAGHFTWYEAPGCVLDAMLRLASGTSAPEPRTP